MRLSSMGRVSVLLLLLLAVAACLRSRMPGTRAPSDIRWAMMSTRSSLMQRHLTSDSAASLAAASQPVPLLEAEERVVSAANRLPAAQWAVAVQHVCG